MSLRPGYIYGPYNNVPVSEPALFARIDRDRPILVPGDGRFPSHHTHARDLAEAVLASLQRDEAVGRAYTRIHRSKLDGAGCRAGGEFGGCAGVRRAMPGAGRSEEPSLSAARGR